MAVRSRYAVAPHLRSEMGLIVVSFVVAILALLVGLLYREIGLIGRRMESASWPLRKASPGSSVQLRGISSGHTGFVLLASDDRDNFGEVMSLLEVARRWDESVLIQAQHTGLASGWLDTLPADSRLAVVADQDGSASQLGAVHLPVAIYLRDGVLLDATTELVSPSRIAERFVFVAAPMPSEGLHATLYT